ncbi:MAG: NfeD family protein [Bacteroidales bacterium]|jgi:membrane protein implicated in regulation of membrane protease activity|nr:NfeD family protein [Bacteroidales bacterium]
MEIYQYWLIAAIVLVIVEICTAGFGSICFAVGAGFSALVAGLGGSFVWQIIVFAAVSLLTFIFLRPMAIRWLDSKSKDVKTNVDALIGRKGIVSERIDATQHTGRVAVDGDDWKAVSLDNAVIDKGASVEIVNRDSLILTVKRLV